MLSDWELWACALEVQREQGETAPRFVVERIGALVLEGDFEGVEAWKGIALRLQQLQAQSAQPND